MSTDRKKSTVAPSSGPALAPPLTVSSSSEPEPVSLPAWRVTYGDVTEEIRATSAREAWALFCDEQGNWPTPDSGKVEPV